MRRILIVVAIALAATACTRGAADDTTTSTTTPPDETTTTTTTSGIESQASTTTSTTSTSTTTTPPTTTSSPSTTTTTTAPTTTITIPDDNEPPTIEIVAPGALSAHTAAYDTDQEDFGAYVSLAAVVGDPNRDEVRVRWSASTQGFLGTGESLVVWLSTQGSDAKQPVITATAVDRWGVETAASVQIIVWIPSDT